MPTIPQNPFILIDGSSYLYRAFYALPPLTNSKGKPTGAVYGVLNMIRKLIKDFAPAHCAVVFDAKGKTFRDELFEKYKANRPPMPDDLIVQIEPLHQLVQALGIPLLVVDGVEADDVIGTLAMQAKELGLHTLISTGDKDMAQIVNGHVTLINTMSNKIMDRDGVIEKFGIPPECIIDYLALVGDSVDNIPGIPSVGPKTAAKWLLEYKSLDNIIENADKITGKVGENLRSHLQELPVSKLLATIKLDVELPVKPNELKLTAPHRERLVELYSELEFKTLLKAALDESATAEPKNSHYTTIVTEKDFDGLLDKLQHAKSFVFSTESTSLHYMQSRLVGLSFATNAHEAFYIPVAHDYENAPQQLSLETVSEKLNPIFSNVHLGKIGHNLKLDLHALANHGIALNGIQHDTMLESYVLNSSATRHDTQTLALKYLSRQALNYEDVAGKGAKQISFNQITVDNAAGYAAEKAEITSQLHEKFWQDLKELKGPCHIYKAIEIPLLSVLARIERNGVLIDEAKLALQSKAMEKRIHELEQEAYAISGSEFNLSSPKQLQEILFDRLKHPALEKTPKGQPSTAESALQTLALDYPLPKIILEHRSLCKLKSTYTDTLPQQMNPATGRVHTSYNQAVTATGRLSSTDPNLQNIPIRNELGRMIRQAFIAPKGYKIIAADYSQIELRIMAHLSGDKGLSKAFAEGVDIHKATAAEVFGVTLDAVTHEQRRNAKAINFGLIYGMSAFGLSRQLGISTKLAKEYMDLYFHRYPRVQEYMEKTREFAHQHGFVETVLGRRLYLPEINSKNMMMRRAAERAAINAPMQGTAADIIKTAMITVDQWIQETDLSLKLIMQVHDELVFEVKGTDCEAAVAKIRDLMSEAATLTIPLIVDVGVGENWDQAH